MQKDALNANGWRRSLAVCALMTFAWGVLVHTYGLSNGLFSHDSLNALFAGRTEEIWKVQLGRFLVPAYRALVRPGLAMPWLIGMLGFAYIALSVTLICDAVRLKSNAARLLLSGIFTVNVTVSALIATYNYEFDVDMLAFLLSACAFWLWSRNRWGFLAGALAVSLSLALYQAYFATALSLCMVLLIVRLISGESAKKVLMDGLKAAAMLALGALLYWMALRVVCACTGIRTDAEAANGLGNLKHLLSFSLPKQMAEAWLVWFKKLVRLVPAWSREAQIVLNLALLIPCGFALVRRALRQKVKASAWAMLALLIVLLPLGMNAVYVLSGGLMHYLMVQPCLCVYALGIALTNGDKTEKNRTGRALRCAAAALLGVLLLGNAVSANAMYLKKDLEKQATLSWMTRAVERIESAPGYEKGVTPVAIYGVYGQETPEGFEKYRTVSGMSAESAISVPLRKETFDLYKAYLQYILNCDISFCDLDAWAQIMDSEALSAMPAFPDPDCVKTIDGVLVLKMGDRYKPDAGEETR